ncbi:Alpha/Beta hydrolase protein [Desarmillaria tabescens]|uniref:Alpha/Beta hydrolase protein n=1 Tax=Armillaria tabescens TaxID=1929756 RepID=A0AA39K7I3_ARMTA|nr:Alpha/Beta hydrolase protein [Desarmillaria tabescens]XP_060329250.1 Alpha/Beta hydrolase protein [Desarmillaria tabescens]KAK0455738.1 Alpha/Beta hydrolase protein [Desarmillaria tabescens]KAK0455740.1 Alpha/Beta hydrolase protein [Desarmillaria tabescens]
MYVNTYFFSSDSLHERFPQLPASDSLEWVDCYTGFQCTNLKVPLNYSSPDNETIVLAIIQYPSPLPVNSTDYKGPLLFNPGGPGGSGVDYVLEAGAQYSQMFQDQYDIVGFDPRGVARSTRVSFYETGAERALWDYNILVELLGRPDGIENAWAQAIITGQLAGERDNNGLLAHINTDQTARDMLKITEAYGQEKLQYWGFSYGTILGATFAAMFPDKIERMVLDGVVDTENYYATLWSDNLTDSNKTLQAFFDGCYQAGPDGCPFYDSSPDAIKQNLDNLYDTIRARPLPVRLPTAYGVVDYARLRYAVFSSLYIPQSIYWTLAKGLSELAQGNGEGILNLTAHTPFECSCDDPSALLTSSVQDSMIAVICNDGLPVPRDVESAEAYYANLSAQFEWASIWTGVRIGCAGWPDYPKTNFRGPFTGNTSYPILFVGNTADPVAPLAAAKKVASGFDGSVVLTQDSPGHCSISANSPCTQGYIRDYFINGTLPELDTVCPIVGTLFDNTTTSGWLKRDLSGLDSEEQFLEAVRRISYSAKIPTTPLSLVPNSGCASAGH